MNLFRTSVVVQPFLPLCLSCLAAGGQQPQGSGHKGQTQQKGAEKGLNAAPYLLELSSFACMPLIYVFSCFYVFSCWQEPQKVSLLQSQQVAL